MFEKEQQELANQVQILSAQAGVPLGAIQWSWIPFSGNWGLSTSFFQPVAAAAKARGEKTNIGQKAQEIAAQVASELSLPIGFERAEAIKGYLNVYFSSKAYARRVIDIVLEEGAAFGRAPRRGRRTMVEFAQPNTHKSFHVGHLRNVILGNVVCNLIDAAGDDVIRTTYLGDIGLHVIKWMWCYLKYHAGEKPTGDITRWMGDLYTEASQRAESEPGADGEIRELFARWDRRDPEIVALWKETRQWSVDGFEEIFKTLGVGFDHYYFESDVEDSGKVVVDELIERGIADDERPENAVVVKLDEKYGTKDKYRVLVVLRSDGTSLYATKDLALAIQKFAEFKLDRSVYVIDVRQSLYLTQVFKTLELMGYSWTKDCYHLSYEIVNLPGNVTMSSRDGTVVFLNDLLAEAKARALEIVREKNDALSEAEKVRVAELVALGALKYSMVSRDNTKIVTFDWASALDFNGQAAPYIQYAAVRANSILKRTEAPFPESAPLTYDLSEVEIELIDLMTRLPKEILRSANEMKPLYVTSLAFDLAKTFNEFYRVCPVMKAEGSVRDFRLRLTAAARQAIVNSLAVLGIETPDVM